MLDRCAGHIARVLHHPRNRLGGTAGKNHFRHIAADQRSHLPACLFNHHLGRTPFGMDAGRVACHIHRRQHGRARLCPQGRGRVMIKVYSHISFQMVLNPRECEGQRPSFRIRLVHDGKEVRHRRTGGKLVRDNIRQPRLVQKDIDLCAQPLPQTVGQRLRPAAR